jgi:thymidylate synthase ThyX
MINQISAKVVLDSVSRHEERLTTVEVVLPRFILAELNTHRVFSRNSASSRAIPLSKQISKIMEDPFVPKVFMENKPGMQAATPLDDAGQKEATDLWLKARDAAFYYAEKLGKLNVHKQWASRILEPFMWHTAIVSSTEWDNFFSQRLSKHGMAQPEFGELADKIYGCINSSDPTYCCDEEWHMPYLRDDDVGLSLQDKLKVSVARCARVSYLNHDGLRSIDDDLALWDRLKDGQHLSPLEHVAQPDYLGTGNFNGWAQLRSWAEGGRLSALGL